MADTSELRGKINETVSELVEGCGVLHHLDRCSLKGILSRLEWARDRMTLGSGELPSSTAFNRPLVTQAAAGALVRLLNRGCLAARCDLNHLNDSERALVAHDLRRVCRVLGIEEGSQ